MNVLWNLYIKIFTHARNSFNDIRWLFEKFNHKIAIGGVPPPLSKENQRRFSHEPQCSHDTIDLKTRAPVYSILNKNARRS